MATWQTITNLGGWWTAGNGGIDTNAHRAFTLESVDDRAAGHVTSVTVYVDKNYNSNEAIHGVASNLGEQVDGRSISGNRSNIDGMLG